MTAPRSPAPTSESAAKPAGPGRPKDLGKRAAILDAAKTLFTANGFDGVSMDQIAAAAGVSKLTVYSHFGDKETLFVASVKAYCEMQLPSSLFVGDPETPLRECLMVIGRAFVSMVNSPEAVAGHRMLCTPQAAASPLPQMFWEAGPKRVQDEFAAFLQRRADAGELDLPDIALAGSQFLCLLKGEMHARLVFGCGPEYEAGGEFDTEAHVAATVEMFLRAYGRHPA